MKKIIIVFSIVLTIILEVYAISESKVKSEISSANSSARIHYKCFTNGLIELADYPDINLNGECYIFGECRDFTNYTAYQGDSVKSDTLLFGAGTEHPNGYWAVKIIDGKVKEAWASNYQLKKEQLHGKKNNLNPLETILTLLRFYRPQFIGYYKE